MQIQTKFGRNVRTVREAKGWSQDSLAEATGLHRTYLSGIERGVRNPTLVVVQKIATALQVSAAKLLEDK